MLQAARETAGAWSEALRALHGLFLAELDLARAALLRSLWLAALALGLTVATCLLLIVLAVLGLQALGLPWTASVAFCLLASALLTGLTVWRLLRTLRLARFEATRRQLARGRTATESGRPPEEPPA
ncbi:hypothetical protein [Arenimonas fontis]|uniref:hypothetical protein n=1 Tax=Arenimonas fontis TaxID=2608255 RepID=UPI001AEE2D27|nr:hypothetical protein [Arenimonas fontis]